MRAEKKNAAQFLNNRIFKKSLKQEIRKRLGRSGFRTFFAGKTFLKKGLDKTAGRWYNFKRCREQGKRRRAILENDTEKVILYKEVDAERESARMRRQQSDSERVKRLDEMEKMDWLWRAGSGVAMVVEDKD